MNIKWALLFWYIRTVTGDCDYYQKLDATSRYTITSPGYPSRYTGEQICQWIVDCPPGYHCRLNCPEVNLPESYKCKRDKLLVSESGDLQLTGAKTYCGKGSLSSVSTGQRLSIGLVAPADTKRGRFRCEVTAQPSTPNSSCACGYRRQNRIVGGQETGINEYPMMALIADRMKVRVKCGGVIISNKHIMTAAHCVYETATGDIAVIVGEHNTTINDSPATKGYIVSKINPHPLFSDSNYDYDIAILTVDPPIDFSDRVGPVCLPFKYVDKDFAGDKLTILGWGTLFTGGPISTVLEKVDVDVITQMECRKKEPTVKSRQMCTYTPGKDACQVDSGGPLLYTDPNTALLYSAGIVSTGRSCASGLPSINTRVTSLLEWIRTTAINADFCIK